MGTIDMPPARTGNLREDFDRLWDWSFKLYEYLRLREEEDRGKAT